MGIEVIQCPVDCQISQHDDLLDAQHHAALRPLDKCREITGLTLAEANDSQAWANRLSVSMSGAMTNIVLGLWGAHVLRMAGLR
ncbi:hypothetical protein PS710_00135 [Pseudomonas fluorescens]|uniref:Uncharacterized protein n=1 Tax=Pseudomonas fluorescens TaxID=294 RepID=A0A5E6ZRE7_PSEFL|nr:hypothetical protein PS710_00135 [Pseudomonas fluorescens]